MTAFDPQIKGLGWTVNGVHAELRLAGGCGGLAGFFFSRWPWADTQPLRGRG